MSFFLRGIFIVTGALLLASCSAARIVDKPVVFNEQRKQLTLEYLKERYRLEQSEPQILPKMIVLHWTAIPDLERSFKAFRDPVLPNWRPEIAGAGALNVSAHFLIDRDGTIYRLVPEEVMARHVIGLNHCAIGVENVGGTQDTPLTKAQVRANIKLIKYLKKKYPIDYLIGHYEYTLFEGHELWLETNDAYRTEKTDPGPAFMNEVRNAVKQLNFKLLPQKNTQNGN
ncbi:peptidoglycan recognition family protein [Ascidiimonas aurantiaca]|uniref:N-acetylmuramoyl-L-alanine amidase n=1 Tax=Ascidiimonas aurantiaca TaxID=1685432 RepID=UPI0030EDABC8